LPIIGAFARRKKIGASPRSTHLSQISFSDSSSSFFIEP